MPFNYTVGFQIAKTIYNKSTPDSRLNRWSIGADYTAGQWTDYRFYGSPDRLDNSYMYRVGGEVTPNILTGKGFFETSTYRAGFYTGKDYINADGNGYKVTAFTLGVGFNLRKYRSSYNQYTLINTSFEFGKRGTNVNNITEKLF